MMDMVDAYRKAGAEKGKTMDKELVKNTFGEIAEMAGLLMGQMEEKGFSHEDAVSTASKMVVEMIMAAVRGEVK